MKILEKCPLGPEKVMQTKKDTLKGQSHEIKWSFDDSAVCLKLFMHPL
jgi:hypothetical protein